MLDGDLDDSCNVFRLVPATQHVLLTDPDCLPVDQLLPSTEDRKQSPVRISVWDCSKTSLEQALAFRPSDRQNATSFTANVEVLRQFTKLQEYTKSPINVCYDLYPGLEPYAGRDGHCGILGLSSGEKLGKIHRRQKRVALMEFAELFRRG